MKFPLSGVELKDFYLKNLEINTLTKTIILVAKGGVVIAPPMATELLVQFNTLVERNDAENLATLLSKREREVLSLVAQGYKNKEIAATLVISDNTVKVHLRNIMDKLHAHTRQQAVSLIRREVPLPRVEN